MKISFMAVFMTPNIRTSEPVHIKVPGGVFLPIITDFLSPLECKAAFQDGIDFRLVAKVLFFTFNVVNVVITVR